MPHLHATQQIFEYDTALFLNDQVYDLFRLKINSKIVNLHIWQVPWTMDRPIATQH
jgi:hypothetical protein